MLSCVRFTKDTCVPEALSHALLLPNNGSCSFSSFAQPSVQTHTATSYRDHQLISYWPLNAYNTEQLSLLSEVTGKPELVSLHLITYPSQEHCLKYVKTCLFLSSPLNYIQDIIPAKYLQFKKPLSERHGKSYHHMLASQNITITKLTLQNKVGVKSRGRKIWTSNRIDGLIIVALYYRVTSADWKLGYINKPFTLKCEMKEGLPSHFAVLLAQV